MAKYGFNFRDSSGFVSDGTDDTYVIDQAYPQTRNGITFGYTTSRTNLRTRDRDSGVNAKVAGIHFNDTDVTDFQIDLPSSGTWSVRLAIGDCTYDPNGRYCKVLDNTTELISIAHAGTEGGGGIFYDATDVKRTSVSDWVTNNAQSSQSFSTTTCVVRFGGSVGNSCTAHVELEQAAAGTTRGAPFGARGTAFNGGRTFMGILR